MKKLMLASALLFLLSGCSLGVFGSGKADELVEFNNEQLNKIIEMEEKANEPILEAVTNYDIEALIAGIEDAKPQYDKMLKEIDSWEFKTDEVEAKAKQLREVVKMSRENLDVQQEAFETEDEELMTKADETQMKIEEKAVKFDKDLKKLADEWDVEITDQELE